MALLSFCRLPTKNELTGICVDILSHMALFRFFCLTSHLLINFSSDFVFFCVFVFLLHFLVSIFNFCFFLLFFPVCFSKEKEKERKGWYVGGYVSRLQELLGQRNYDENKLYDKNSMKRRKRSKQATNILIPCFLCAF